MNRRVSLFLLTLALLAAFLVPTSACAQGYPNRSVRLVVPFPAGGPADALGRVIADQLNKMWGQPVIIENRGGRILSVWKNESGGGPRRTPREETSDESVHR